MQVVRLGASRVKGLGWQKYDEQLRLKMSVDPTTSWESIDQELWLLFMVDCPVSSLPQNNQVMMSSTAKSYPVMNMSSINKCYNYNYKGICERNPCFYKHVCFRCSGAHPFLSCPQNTTNQYLRPRAPIESFSVRNAPRMQHIRPRFPGYSFRAQGQTGPRYLGPRQVANKY